MPPQLKNSKQKQLLVDIERLEQEIMEIKEKLDKYNEIERNLNFIPSGEFKNEVVEALYLFDNALKTSNPTDTCFRDSFGRKTIYSHFHSIKLRERHIKTLRTKTRDFGEWMSTQTSCDIKSLTSISQDTIRSWETGSQNYETGSEIEDILDQIRRIISINTKYKRHIFLSYYCRLCFKPALGNGKYCSHHTPNPSIEKSYTSYRKGEKLLKNAAKQLFYRHPDTKETLFGIQPISSAEILSTNSKHTPYFDMVWLVLYTHENWEIPNSAYSPILDDYKALKCPNDWLDWAEAFSVFISDLPRLQKKFDSIKPLTQEKQFDWIQRLTKTLDYYNLQDISDETDNFLIDLCRYDQYLLIQELAKEPIPPPIDKELYENIRYLKVEEDLSIRKIAEKISIKKKISKTKVGKIIKELGL